MCVSADLLVEFITSHMMKRLPVELYRQCIGIIHRLLCYQKKCTVRINYNWKMLWEALITLLKFLIVYDNHASKEVDVFRLTSQASTLFESKFYNRVSERSHYFILVLSLHRFFCDWSNKFTLFQTLERRNFHLFRYNKNYNESRQEKLFEAFQLKRRNWIGGTSQRLPSNNYCRKWLLFGACYEVYHFLTIL